MTCPELCANKEYLPAAKPREGIYFLYLSMKFFGDIPFCFLKKRLKEHISGKLSSYETSETLRSLRISISRVAEERSEFLYSVGDTPRYSLKRRRRCGLLNPHIFEDGPMICAVAIADERMCIKVDCLRHSTCTCMIL